VVILAQSPAVGLVDRVHSTRALIAAVIATLAEVRFGLQYPPRS